MAEEKKYGLEEDADDDYNECVLDPNNDRRTIICDSENASDAIIQCIGSIETQYIPDSKLKQAEKIHGTGTVIHMDDKNNIYVLTAAHNIYYSEKQCKKCKTKTIKTKCPKCLSKATKTGALIKPTHIYFSRRGNGAKHELGKIVKKFQVHKYEVHKQYNKFPTPRGGFDIAVMVIKCNDKASINLYKENCKTITLVNDITFGANKSVLHIFGYPGDKRMEKNYSVYYYLFGMGTSKLNANNQFEIKKNNDSNKLYIVNRGIDTTVGQSGSCIYSYNGDDTERYLLYGVHCGGSTKQKANFGTLLDMHNMEWVANILVDSNVHKYMICHYSMFNANVKGHSGMPVMPAKVQPKKVTVAKASGVKKPVKWKYDVMVVKKVSKNGQDVWNGYVKQFGKPPASASYLWNYSKTSQFNTLNFKQAREVFNAHQNVPQDVNHKEEKNEIYDPGFEEEKNEIYDPGLKETKDALSEPEDDSDEYLNVVVYMNSATIQAGYAGDDVHTIVIPNIVAGNGNNMLIGHEVKNKKVNISNVRNTFENGEITDWDGIEQILRRILSKIINKNNIRLLITETINTPKNVREKLIKLAFEKLHCVAYYAAWRPVWALYANGRTTGIVVLSEYHRTEVAVIFEGYMLLHASAAIMLGKRDVLEYVEKTKGLNVNDGMELLFTPSLCESTKNYDGIHKLVHQCILKSDTDIRKDLWGNVILCGMNTMYDGLKKRLQKELEKLSTSSMTVKVIAPPDRKYSVWIGGSILSSLSTFDEMWVTKDEYDKSGPPIVHKKCVDMWFR